MTDKLKGTPRRMKWFDQVGELRQELIHKLDETNSLHHADFNKDFKLFCDASDIGISGILIQDGK